MLGWHPTLFQAALASSLLASFLLAVLVGKALRFCDELEESRRWDDAVRALSSAPGELPPGFVIVPEPPYDWSVDA